MGAEREGRQLAEQFRRDHHLGDQPLGDLVALVEQATDCEVAVLDTSDLDEHGLSMRDPDSGAIFIGIARTHHPMRQRSMLAHELAHVLFEDWDGQKSEQPGGRSQQEIRADAFARHLLIPERGARDFLGPVRALHKADLSDLVQRFLASPNMAAIALHRCGYISDEMKTEWMRISTPQLACRFG